MPKIDDTIKNAIEAASLSAGSQYRLAKIVGITPAALNRYLKGKVHSINASTWNILFPQIKDFLPEQYHRTFMAWKSPAEWKDFAVKHPEPYREINRQVRDIDIAEVSSDSPLFGRNADYIQTLDLLTKKLPHLSEKTLLRFLAEAINEINSQKENNQ